MHVLAEHEQPEGLEHLALPPPPERLVIHSKQPASAPHMLRIVPHTVPRVSRSYEPHLRVSTRELGCRVWGVGCGVWGGGGWGEPCTLHLNPEPYT